MGAIADVPCYTKFLREKRGTGLAKAAQNIYRKYFHIGWFFCRTLCCKKWKITDFPKILRIFQPNAYHVFCKITDFANF
jgi:hypothetical protein